MYSWYHYDGPLYYAWTGITQITNSQTVFDFIGVSEGLFRSAVVVHPTDFNSFIRTFQKPPRNGMFLLNVSSDEIAVSAFSK
jgi:hypothetical protein